MEHDRGKSCSTNAMPLLANRFERFHEFAVASLQDIYTPTYMESAQRFAASSLQTGIWRNDGDGRFEFLPLPAMAQASPTFGVLICEANGDGNPDLLLAQNFFGPQAETGRADGGVGLLLTGNGDCTFSPVSAGTSGIVVPGDATSACLADVDGDGLPELFVTTNDGPCHAFAFSASGKNPPVVVRLKDADANSPAIGSRVTAHFSDGSTQTAEVAAGGGYLSQSTADIFFLTAPDRGLVQIDVVWPDGQVTTVKPELTGAPVILHQPASSGATVDR